jgi:hypothetical protein
MTKWVTKWEYWTVLQKRVFDTKNDVLFRATEWRPELDLTAAGANGWELVSVVPTSGLASASASADVAGFTDQLLWVFKRPKP